MKTIFSLSFLFLFLVSNGQQNISYSKTKDFNRISLTLDELKEIVNSIKYYENEEEKDTTKTIFRPTFNATLGSADKSITISSFQQFNDFSISKKEEYTTTSLKYLWYEKPISSVTITFDSYSNRLDINGTDAVKVDALYRDLVEKIKSKEPFTSSFNWSIIIFEFLMFSFVIAIAFIGTILSNWKKSIINKPIKIFTGILALYVLAIVIFFLSPIKTSDIIPNYKLSANDSSFWDRNGSFISMISTITGILIPIFGLAKRYIFNKLKFKISDKV